MAQPSLPFLLVDALAFLVRRFGLFLVVALPISAVAAAIAWLLDTQRSFAAVRGHWGWDFGFVLIYALFLDRWIKEVLLDGATDCDETDNLRRSIVSPRFLLFAAMLFALAAGLSFLPWVVPLILCIAVFALFALALPSFSAAEPLGLGQALRLGRSAWTSLVLLSATMALLSLLGHAATDWGLAHLPHKPWARPAMEAAHRLIDCLLLAFVGYALASLFRQLADWHQPEPEDHPYRDLARARRKASQK